MTDPGWKNCHVCHLSPRAMIEGTRCVPGSAAWYTLLARCSRKATTRVNLELQLNSAAPFPGHMSGSELVGKWRQQVQCLNNLYLRSVIWQHLHFGKFLLFQARTLCNNAQSLMEPSLISPGIKPCFFVFAEN